MVLQQVKNFPLNFYCVKKCITLKIYNLNNFSYYKIYSLCGTVYPCSSFYTQYFVPLTLLALYCPSPLPSQEVIFYHLFLRFLYFSAVVSILAVEFNIHLYHPIPPSILHTIARAPYKMLRQFVFFSVFHCTRINPEPLSESALPMPCYPLKVILLAFSH